MRGFRQTAGWLAAAFSAALLMCGLAGTLAAQAAAAGVTTAGYNNLRDDWDPAEPALTPAAVQSSTFGTVFSTKLEGAIYAQPLVFEGKVIVTTEKADA